MDAAGDARNRLHHLIEYVIATERDRVKLDLDIQQTAGFRQYGHELAGLPGVALNLATASGAVWLQVDRLRKHPAPLPGPAELRIWIDGQDEPDPQPRLKTSVSRSALQAFLPPAAEDEGAAGIELAAYPFADRVRQQLSEYLEKLWLPWAEKERTRRRTITLYNGLYALRQTLESADVASEFVCGIGLTTLYQQDCRLRHPLLTVPLEISLVEKSGTLEVRPRSESQPGVESAVLDRMELHSVGEWARLARETLDGLQDDALSPFCRETFEPILRSAASLLAPHAQYLTNADATAQTVERFLQVTDGFVLYQRARRATLLENDLERLRTQLSVTADLPPAVAALVTEPDAVFRAENHEPYRGINVVPGVTAAHASKDLFFPKPFNREQVEVIQRLDSRPGVVVQGPPGTGKTHTIANIICHYLALGKKVLITSERSPALRVLQGQLPPAVQALAVSLLESDREGLRHFRDSIDVIQRQLTASSAGRLQGEIERREREIDAIHRRLASIDTEVERIGSEATAEIACGGETLQSGSAAREYVAHIEEATWLMDAIDVTPKFNARFTGSDIKRLREARLELGSDLACLDAMPPQPHDLPQIQAVLQAHADLSRAEEIRCSIASGDLPDLHADTADIEALLESLRALDAAFETAKAGRTRWTDAMLTHLRGNAEMEGLQVLLDLQPEIAFLADENRYFLAHPIELPDGAPHDDKLQEAIGRAAAGEAALGFVAGLFAGDLKRRLAAVHVMGVPPQSPAEWADVRRKLSTAVRRRRFAQVWNHAVRQSCLDPILADEEHCGAEAAKQLRHVELLRGLVRAEHALQQEAAKVLDRPWRVLAGSADAVCLRELLEGHLLRRRLSRSEEIRTELMQLLDGRLGELPAKLRHCASGQLGNPAVPQPQFEQEWRALLEEAEALWRKREAFDTVRLVTGNIRESGAPRWADRLRREAATGVTDSLTPADWEQRWRLRRIGTWLARIDHHDRLRELAVQRRELEGRLREEYEAIVEARTWLGLSRAASDSVRSNLAAYADAVKRIGCGTGKSASRHMREARAALTRAKEAVRCWIMPHYRVSESLPAELGMFDLVVVDEASQSTVAALPALLRARQVLIVGDDRQVSPQNVGLNQARADQLADRHLRVQVESYRPALRAERSLYDLGKVVFAGGAIMLCEHFRSVAPIIEYSKAQFYRGELLPLRLPKMSERLDPPLIDIFVEDGYRRGKINPPEADCIVAEIERITADPSMAQRTIGVTTLLGTEQAAHIYKKLEKELGAELIERHRIRVGDPTEFQGDERDIMFLSLVAVRGDTHALSGTGFEQRFNVAASRARDRMILVRSIELDHLSPADKLRRALLEHFASPFPNEARAEDARARCESAFERDMFDLLSRHGFRVDTQVPVGNFRIDMVITGDGDRRLAVECDGDRYHGPGRWADDMARQRVLERAGWEVWRCFASRFYREQEEVSRELLSLLHERGIEPTSGSQGRSNLYTEQRRWRSAAVAEAEADVSLPVEETRSAELPEESSEEPFVLVGGPPPTAQMPLL